MFKTTVFVVVPHKGQPVPQIFGFELNGIDKCPLCGKRLEKNLPSRISGGDDSDTIQWPWHSTVYRIKSGSFSYICGGTLIQNKAVITSGNFEYEFHLHILQLSFLQQIACLKMAKKSANILCK